jgi:hypothetical protein
LLVILSLLVARVATFGLFRVALPIVLGILALFFGGALRNAARRMQEIGQAGEAGLRGAARRVRGLDPEEFGRDRRRRYRVSPSGTLDTEGEAVEEPTEEEGSSREQPRRAGR